MDERQGIRGMLHNEQLNNAMILTPLLICSYSFPYTFSSHLPFYLHPSPIYQKLVGHLILSVFFNNSLSFEWENIEREREERKREVVFFFSFCFILRVYFYLFIFIYVWWEVQAGWWRLKNTWERRPGERMRCCKMGTMARSVSQRPLTMNSYWLTSH